MNAGKALASLILILVISMTCILCVLCGMLAGGIAGLTAGRVAGFAGGWGRQLPDQRWLQGPNLPWQLPQILPPTPQIPRLQPATPTPAPRRTPQAPRSVLPAGQTGAMLQAVDPDSPAEKAGLRAGDLITAVDGASVDENHSLSDLIRAKKPGEKVTLSVLRGTRTLTLDATLGSRKLDTGQEVASLGVTYVSWPPVGPTD